jgi:hypothetical protein
MVTLVSNANAEVDASVTALALAERFERESQKLPERGNRQGTRP